MENCKHRRVLMLLQNSPYSEDGRVRREATALRDAGYSITVICPRAPGERRVMQFDGVRTYQYTQRSIGQGFLGYAIEYGYSMAATFVLSLYVFFRHGFHIIHAHNPPDFFVLIACLYKPFGKRFIFDHHDTAPELYKARFGDRANRRVLQVLAWFERLSCRMADHVLATNESHKALELKRAGIAPARITIVRNGPEAMHFRRVEAHPNLRDCGKTVIGYVGEMGKQDGIDYLIRSLGYLRHVLEREDWICVLIGGGEAFDQLQELARQERIADHVRFIGRVGFEEVVCYLSGMDICTVPDPRNSYNDRCTMIKVMEYMAQGKPIVCFDLFETRYSAQDSAVYVPPNDEREFAQALKLLIDDADLRARLGAAGRRRAELELAWRHYIPKLLDVYERLSNGATRTLFAYRAEGSKTELPVASNGATGAPTDHKSAQPVG